MGKRQSRPWIVSDELWSLIEPLLPEPPPKQVEGRPRVPDRQALCGILFVLHTGIQWEYLPRELGFGSGMTCWRRLAAWNEAGVWDQLHQLLLNKLRSKNQLDWSRAVIDSFHVRAARRGPKADSVRSTAHVRAASTTSSPRAGDPARGVADLRKPQRHHPTAALLDKIPAVAGVVGRPRHGPDMLFADRGYDHDKYRRLLRQRGIRPAIAERGQPHGTGLGTFRWVVERTISWLHGSRCLRIRWERRNDIHEAFLSLAVCLITHRHVQRLW
ncbi:IS5 family transposase [Streptomyces chartreusis]|uniref:IS5 family transposase n=1 Tax=Streptomyces chartreusis TaxID=1969 RepID=UPI0036A811FD